MLCSTCRRQIERGATACRVCGAPLPGADASHATALELVLENGVAVALPEELTIGRAAGNALRLDDPSVSRRHARVTGGEALPFIEDVASSHGTFLDGARLTGPTPLQPGAQIQLGDLLLRVRPAGSHDDDHEGDGTDPSPGHTVVVPAGASVLLSAVGEPEVDPAVPAEASLRPRLRSGYRLKQLGQAEASWWVLENLRSGDVVRLEALDGVLLSLLDGRSTLLELIGESERRAGPVGPGRLARLLADFGERGLLAGVDARDRPRPTGWRRLLAPREWATRRLGAGFEALYLRGGWILFTRPAVTVFAFVAVAGLLCELALIAFRYGSPLIVASHLGLGGLVFLVARALLVACHETAHGLALASYGRRVTRAGLRLVLIFPFAFVETTEAWFEPRRHRITVTLAGPAADFVLGGAFAIACLLLAEGTGRDILFQAAFAAYVGAVFNLNPFLDRDGYGLLVDVLRRPQLRARARAEFARRLSGQGAADDDPALRRYALAGLVWSVAVAFMAIGLSLLYLPVLEQFAPPTVVHVVVGTVWLALFIPAAVTVVPPLASRLRR